MSWFRAEASIRTHPKIAKLARRLGVPIPHARGLLVGLWAWASVTAEDGNLTAYDAEDLAIAADWDGDAALFYQALIDVRLVDVSEDGQVVIHEWMERSARHHRARNRELARKRQQNHRSSRSVTLQDRDSHAREDGEDGEERTEKTERTDGEEMTEEIGGYASSSPELSLSAPASGASPPLLVFPTTGPTKTWTLTEEHVRKWSEVFESLDVLGQCRHALAWIEANPGRRKTARGMPKFLLGWFSRAVDRGGRSGFGPNRSEQIKNAFREWNAEMDKREGSR